MSDIIKIGSLNISAFKVGSDNCKIYLGDTLLYPKNVSYKLVAQYSNTTEYKVECNGSTALTESEVTSYTTSKTAMTSAVISNCGESAFKVGNNSFCGCTSLSSVTLSEGITQIGNQAFRDTPNLRSITFPSTLDTIEATAFRLSGLRNVSGIPSGVTTLGSGAFADCLSLTSATIPSSVTGSSTNLFLRDSGLTEVHFEGTTAPALGADAFNGCTSLVKIYIPSCDCYDSYAAQSQFSGKTNLIYAENNERCNLSFKLYRALKNGVTNTTACNSSSALTQSDVRANYAMSVLTSSTSGLTEATVGDCITSIDSEAFIGMTQLSSITLANSVTGVGASACTSIIGNATNRIHDVKLSNNLKTIGVRAFSNIGGAYATNQPKVNIPKSVTSIGDRAFQDAKMNELTFENGGNMTIGHYAFSGLSSYSGISINTDSIRTLGYQTFHSASALRTVYLSGVTAITYDSSIGITGSTFGLCNNMTDFTIIGDGNLAIPRYFVDGSSLTAITLGGIASISNSYGLNQGNITASTRTLTMLDKVPPEINATSISQYNPTVIYVPCNSLNAYKTASHWSDYASKMEAIPDTCVFEGKYMLTLTSSTVVSADCDANSAVTSANVYTQYARTLASAEIGDCVTEIGRRAFYRCSAMTSCDLGKNITTIGQDAIRQCYALSSITLPNSVTSIGHYAFYQCTGLTSIDIPNSVTSIGSSAFERCTSLTSVTIPNFDISFGSGAFAQCSGLTTLGLEGSGASIEIPNGTTTIGAYIFSESRLTSATIPSSVTTIGQNAFSNCSNLTSITFYATTPPTLGRQALYAISGRCIVYVPAASVDAYNSVLSEYNLTAQPIPT